VLQGLLLKKLPQSNKEIKNQKNLAEYLRKKSSKKTKNKKGQ